MSNLFIFALVVVVVLLVVLILGAILMIKAVSMYKQSEKDKKYDAMLSQPLEKLGDNKLEDLEKKYQDDK